MIVDFPRKLIAPLRRDTAPMPCNRRRHIDRSPAQQPAAPCQIRILAIGEEIFVEILPVDRRIIEGRTAVHGCRAAWTENLFRRFELPFVLFAGASVEMPLLAQHNDAGRIDSPSIHANELSACRSSF